MAHTFNVAIELKCEVSEVTWSIVRGKPFSWRPSELFPSLGVILTGPAQHAGKKIYTERALPSELRHELASGRLSAASRKREFEFILGKSTTRLGERSREIDPWILRSDLFALDPRKTSNKDLVKFLNRCGQWSDPLSISFGYECLFLPFMFWRDRKKLIATVKAGTSGWDDPEFFSGLGMRRRAHYPHLVHIDRYCFDAMLSTVTFDAMRGVKFGVCARADCRRPFPIESQHRRIYCDQYCGHLVSVRKRRSDRRSQSKSKN